MVEGGKGLVQQFRKIGGKPGRGFKVNLFAIPIWGSKRAFENSLRSLKDLDLWPRKMGEEAW